MSANVKYMRKANRINKSFTLEAGVLAYVEKSKGSRSASERVNQLLKRAALAERYDDLELEAARFFAAARPARNEARSFQKAAIRSLARD